METLNHTSLATVRSDSAQTTHRQRGEFQGIGNVHDPTQHLVIPGGAQFEVVTDGPVLGTRIEPPGALELENGLFAICKHGKRVKPCSREEWYLRAERAEALLGC